MRRPAEACSFIGPQEHMLDPDEQQEDTEPPGVPAIAELEVFRNPMPNGGCETMSNSCEGTGVVQLTLSAQDDRSATENMGYTFALAGGELPEGLTLPTTPIRADSQGLIVLIFHDEDQTVDFSLEVRAVDLGGNAGDPVVVDVVDGSGGCRVGGGGQAVPMGHSRPLCHVLAAPPLSRAVGRLTRSDRGDKRDNDVAFLANPAISPEL